MIKEMIQRHLVCTYYMITLVLSFFLLIFYFVFTTVGHYSVSFTHFAPGFAVLFIVVLLKDKVILHNIKIGLRWQKGQVKWLFLSMFLPTILIIEQFLSVYFEHSLCKLGWKCYLLFI